MSTGAGTRPVTPWGVTACSAIALGMGEDVGLSSVSYHGKETERQTSRSLKSDSTHAKSAPQAEGQGRERSSRRALGGCPRALGTQEREPRFAPANF